MGKISSIALYSLGAVLLGTIIYCNVKSEPNSVKLANAKTRLIQQVPDINQKLHELDGKVNITLKEDTLPESVLGATTFTGSNVTIVIDVSKVNAANDRLEPVIGHELYHVWESQFVYGGTEAFCELIAKEKEEHTWYNRSYERSAIARENNLRAYLKATYKDEYRTMKPTRELQNAKTRQ